MEEEKKSEFLVCPGKLETDEAKESFLCGQLKFLYNSMIKSQKNNSEENKFIGAHPITLDRTNWQNLSKFKYYVCEKTDGVRYFLLILSNGKTYLHGRNLKKNVEDQYKNNLQFYIANLKIPINFCESESDVKIKYIFDGELVSDLYESGPKIKFLIFDTLFYNYFEVFREKYLIRLEYSRKFVTFLKMSNRLIKSNNKIVQKCLPYNPNETLIKISLKDFFEIQDCTFLLNRYFLGLPHKQDGLVFTKNDAPYRPGRNDDILKWKEISQQTIDFLVINNEYFNSPKVFNGKFKNRVLDIYLISYNKEFSTNDRILFDFMIVDQEKYDIFYKEIEKLKANSESTVFGIIAECKFNRSLENDFIKEMYQTNFINLLKSKAFFNQENNSMYKNVFEENLNYYVTNNFRGGWEVYGWRPDKSDANEIKTGISIMFGIRNPIERNDLIAYVENISQSTQPQNQFQQQPQSHFGGEPTKKIKR